jgi:hypothetical protein
MIDILFDMRPKYFLIDEIEHLKPEYQTTLLSLMETGILTQTIHKKLRQAPLKTRVLATIERRGTCIFEEKMVSKQWENSFRPSRGHLSHAP